MTPETIENIKNAADIVAVVGERVPLKRSGRNHMGRCPFHEEKTPSFTVVEDKKIFYCFGCGAGGDVIAFVQKIDGVGFGQAARDLADRFGVAIPADDGSHQPAAPAMPKSITPTPEPPAGEKRGRQSGAMGGNVAGSGGGYHGSGSGSGPGGNNGAGVYQGASRSPDWNSDWQGYSWTPRRYDAPLDLWMQKADRFVGWCHQHLLSDAHAADLAWLESRGISRDTVREFRLGWNPGYIDKTTGTAAGKDLFRARDAWGLPPEIKENGQPKKLWLPRGLVIPVYDAAGAVMRIRIRRPEPRYPEKPKYFLVPGSTGQPMIFGPSTASAFAVVESELDGMLIYQAAGDLVSVVVLGSSSTRPDDVVAAALSPALCILDVLDADQGGTRQQEFWQTNFPQVERWPVPQGKDPGEAYAAGVDIRAWILSGLPPRFRVEARLRQSRVDRHRVTGPVVGDDAVFADIPPAQHTADVELPPGGDDIRNGYPDQEGGGPAADDPVSELIRVMRGRRIAIAHDARRLGLHYDPDWGLRNAALVSDVSRLVYQVPAVTNWIFDLPYGLYTGERLDHARHN
jgi:hypothetical protein